MLNADSCWRLLPNEVIASGMLLVEAEMTVPGLSLLTKPWEMVSRYQVWLTGFMELLRLLRLRS